MKVCISAAGPGLDAQVDPRFGRCQYFAIVDADTMEGEFIDNANIAASGGAGIQSAQFVANKGVEAVLTGNVGPNAYTTLQAAGIKIITGVSGTVGQAAEAYKRGRLAPPIAGPTAEAHSGMGGTAQIPGQGVGGGRGQGMGMGRGMGRGMGMGPPPPGSTPPGSSSPSLVSKAEEVRRLKEQSEALSDQLDEIRQRIDKLEKQ